jgi:hypothetical protein
MRKLTKDETSILKECHENYRGEKTDIDSWITSRSESSKHSIMTILSDCLYRIKRKISIIRKGEKNA